MGPSSYLFLERFGHPRSFSDQSLTPRQIQHAADIFENGAQSASHLYPHWRWRNEKPRGNGLEEGPAGPRNLQGRDT